ncbi:ADP-ribosyl cyclase/cyclic ADP-ribose hydrolase [Citrus sinensis]|nr:ADP-ribosyl cyclase/cyclic ADP-ribose hydrolase [Citrus sinensis]
MGGLGKTTLARVIYDLISHEFEGSSFVANVREKSEREGGVISFQRQLVSQLLKLTDNRIWNEDDGINILRSRLQHKKVLLVIDDVVDSKQLEYLAGKHGWYGSGSRIIITSRDEGLLKTNGVDEVYKPNGLNYNEALQLFNMKAFKTNQPLEERVQLSERFVNYAGGVPLAIEVLGSFLNVRSVDQWRSTLERLQIDPPNKIMSILQISFDRLQDSEKKINTSNRLRLLDWHRYPLKSLPSNLQLDKTIEFKMCYSRIEELWKGIKSLPISLTRLKCLRTLKLSGCSKFRKFPEIWGSMKDLTELFLDGTSITEVPSSIELLTGLQLLNLNNCNDLVRLPSGINGLKSLQTLNLSGCSKLENVPETLGQIESLEELDISGTAIRRPASSIFLMKNIKTLSFSGCCGQPSSTSWHLQFLFNWKRRSSDLGALSLISLSGLCSLSKLDLSYCDLGEGTIPSGIGSLYSLKKLYMSGNNFVSLPASINCLFKLEILVLEDCKRLQSLPQLPPNVKKVKANGCASLVTLLGALKLRKSYCTLINCIGSLKLLGNNGLEFSMLREYLKEVSDQRNFFFIVVPGSEIPKWFMYQNEGSSITVRRPSYLHNKNRVVGYAICSVYHVPKH